ncbi:MAG: threonine-phosphate decarboxylase [Magnetospirillum sp.]|nr:threonine-phosphate decarboxylase [Magnetospirillum sp.]
MTLPLHGGDLAAAEVRWGRPSAGWLDLSTGVNPWPYPLPPLPDSAWHRLPGTAEEGALRRAAAYRYRLPGADFVLPAPGSGALIQALPRVYPPGPVAVVGPTYGEHARAWTAAGHEVRPVESLAAAAGAPVVVVVNPNNPDGRLLSPEAVAATRCTLLVVDEAFGDVVPEASVVPRLRPGMVVLRSFGKFYGLAGLRLGFALGLPAQLAPVATALGPWAVSGPALAVGAKALADDGWALATRAHLAAMASRLDAVLGEAGLTVVGGTTLFRLARHPEAGTLWNRLGRAGILVRSFAERPGLLRFGLPGSEAELARLSQSLSP